MIKLAASAAGLNSEPQPATSSAVSNIEYRISKCGIASLHLFIKIDRIQSFVIRHSLFDIRYSLFFRVSFSIRLAVFCPAAGLTPETFYNLAVCKNFQPKRSHRSSGGGRVHLRRTDAEFFRQYPGYQTLAGLTLAKSHPGPGDAFDAV